MVPDSYTAKTGYGKIMVVLVIGWYYHGNSVVAAPLTMGIPPSEYLPVPRTDRAEIWHGAPVHIPL